MDMVKTDVAQIFARTARYEADKELQRPYVWEREAQWEPLWDDVKEAAGKRLAKQPVPDHFFGTIVLFDAGKDSFGIDRLRVIDGQQRLTTLQILLQALYEACAKIGAASVANKIRASTRTHEAFQQNPVKSHLKVWPLPQDQQAFINAMTNEGDQDSTLAGSLINDAKWFFRERIVEWFDMHSEPSDDCGSAVYEVVLSSFKIVEIDLTNEDDRYAVFENLNSRGTPLLQWDLVKSRLAELSNLGQLRDPDAASKAREVVENLDTSDWWREEQGSRGNARPRIDQFLFWWLAMHRVSGLRNEREYRAFQTLASAEVSHISKPLERSLHESLQAYQELELSELEPAWRHFWHRFETLEAKAFMPLVMWLRISNLSDEQVVDCLHILESYLMRRSICLRGQAARQYGRQVGPAIESLETGIDRPAQALARHFADASGWSTDEEVIKALVNNRVYGSGGINRNRLRLILRSIEFQMRTKDTKADDMLVPDSLTIEHIMPQVWQAHWDPPDSADERDREVLINSIGNLTFTNSPLNSSMSNSPWEEKWPELQKHSNLHLNKDITIEPQRRWDHDVIMNRSRRLAKIVTKVWPGPDAWSV